MSEVHRIQEIREYQNKRNAQIYNSFVNTGEDSRLPELISKADFQANYPLEQYEVYSLASIQKFREELMKAEGYTDEAFVEATKGLKSFVVQHEGKKVITFARKKEVGEK